MVMRLLAHTYMGKRWGGGVSINREGGSRARKGGRCLVKLGGQVHYTAHVGLISEHMTAHSNLLCHSLPPDME